MTVKYSTVSKILIKILILMNMCYFLILFSNTFLFEDSFVSKPRMMLFLFVMVMAISFGIIQFKCSNKAFLAFELFLMMAICIHAYIRAMNGGKAWDDALSLVLSYLYTFLSVAILSLLERKQWDLESMMKFLTIAATLDTIARIIDCIYEYFSGSMLWPNLANGILGYRNNIVRINPCMFFILIIPMSFYLYNRSRKKKERAVWLICMIIAMTYVILFWQARSAFMYETAILIFLLYSGKGVTKRKVVKWLVGIIVVYVLINTSYISNFLNSFSMSNAEYGGSTLARLNSFDYFYGKYSENILLGTGLMGSEKRLAAGGGALADIGFLYSIFQLGIPMLLFYICIFGRGFYIAAKIRHKNALLSRLVCSIVLTYIFFGFNIDPYSLWDLSVPFYLAIVEYAGYKINNEEETMSENQIVIAKWKVDGR